MISIRIFMLSAREQTRIRSRANACMVATKRAYVGGQTHAFPYANVRKERHFSKLFHTKIMCTLSS